MKLLAEKRKTEYSTELYPYQCGTEAGAPELQEQNGNCPLSPEENTGKACCSFTIKAYVLFKCELKFKILLISCHDLHNINNTLFKGNNVHKY